MQLDLMRERATTFPDVPNAASIRALRIWHCKFRSLEILKNFHELEELVIGTFPDSSLASLEKLGSLQFLRIIHMPKLLSLSGLEKLSALKILSLATSPASDAAKKLHRVASLAPIAAMPSLAHLELFGVCPRDGSLKELERSKTLRTARFSGYFSDEVARFYAATKIANGFNPPSSFDG